MLFDGPALALYGSPETSIVSSSVMSRLSPPSSTEDVRLGSIFGVRGDRHDGGEGTAEEDTLLQGYRLSPEVGALAFVCFPFTLLSKDPGRRGRGLLKP